MKKIYEITCIAGLLILMAAAAIHIANSQSMVELTTAQEVSLCSREQELSRLNWEDITSLGRPLEATFQRQVGEPIKNTYMGVPIQEILSVGGLTLGPSDTVQITAADSYSVTLKQAEIVQEDHAYLVYLRDGTALDDDSGPYMLVLKQDDYSTRWNKNVVKIQVG